MRENNQIFRQKRIKYLGEMVDSIFTAMPMLSAFSFASTIIILYEVTKGYILNLLPWMNVLYFLVVLVVLFIPLLLVVYKYVIPSVWHFRSTQMSHLEDKLKTLDEKLDRLLKEKSENSSSE